MLSDVVFVFVYYLFGYRKKVVTDNLKLVFPEKSEIEIKSIKKKFYRHMVDMFLEMIKTISISKKSMIKRFIIKNPEELKRLETQNKNLIVMYGHYASYEWSIVIENHTSFKGYGIYKRIKNKYFDSLARRIRSKYNTELIHTKESIAKINSLKASNEKFLIAFLSDQSPKKRKAYHWTNFMNINVPCYTAAEMLAKKMDFAVTYLKITKVKRGYYEAEFVSLTDNASDYKDYEITDKFIKLLEEQINTAPEYYLWTHKRWKHHKKTP